MNLSGRLSCGILLVASGISVSSAHGRDPAPAACTALTGYSYSPWLPSDSLIASAVLNTATATLPEHCQLQGTIDGGRPGYGPTPGDSTTASLNQVYAIRWMLRLPSKWNGRFYFAGGGGTNGNVGDALGGSALANGYAVVSQDSGHDNAVNVTAEAATATFGYDPRARSRFRISVLRSGHAACESADPAALRSAPGILLLRRLFGRRARRPGDVAALPLAFRWHRVRQPRHGPASIVAGRSARGSAICRGRRGTRILHLDATRKHSLG